jgi:hypothetical protein
MGRLRASGFGSLSLTLSRAAFSSALCLLVAGAAPALAQKLVLDDPLRGSTIGTCWGASGGGKAGSFVPGGWRVDEQYDGIFWHVPSLAHGAFEYDVVGIGGECTGQYKSKNELSHMYDHTWNDADHQYAPGYREDPYKQFLRRQCETGKKDTMEILWQILPGGPKNSLEDDCPPLSWDPAVTCHFRMEWENAGGEATIKTFRNGAQIWKQTLPGSWSPGGLSVRIGASTRRGDEGAQIGAIYSNVKVWDLSASVVPSAPTISVPAAGETVNTPVVFVGWTGDPHTRYRVRITTQDSPDAGVFWDSFDTASSKSFSFTGSLADKNTYHAFVRLEGVGGWGPWSAPGRSFRVDTSYVPPGPDVIRLQGNSLRRNSGPAFNGLGATYMQALRRCKYDHRRLVGDLDFLKSRKFNYVRILSMVSWQGKEIAPVGFTRKDGASVAAWLDYRQQFRDCIDTIYDHGLLSEVTIFADAQTVMPDKAERIKHMDAILESLKGREHKVLMLEVANEAWQNGFPGPQGVADLREFARYLSDRTEILVAITATPEGTPASYEQIYAGSGADIVTAHLSRDLGTPEGGWHPVRDSWWLGGARGLPPGSSNEPIGPGSSVSSENDPVKLVMAAVFAWGANLPMYVYHTRAGVRGDRRFEDMAGVNDFVHLDEILPGDFASWVRDDGKEPSAPFTTFADGQASKWWTEVPGATSGVVRHTGKRKSNEFITLPIGILDGGVELEARRPMTFKVYNPLTGQVAYSLAKKAGERFILQQGPKAYIIRGVWLDSRLQVPTTVRAAAPTPGS